MTNFQNFKAMAIASSMLALINLRNFLSVYFQQKKQKGNRKKILTKKTATQVQLDLLFVNGFKDFSTNLTSFQIC